MYPIHDFRYLIKQTNIPESSLISALRREPLIEVLHYWDLSSKSEFLLRIFCQGIENAVALNRYPLYQLNDIDLYPEFWVSCLNGLKKLWISLRFSSDSQNLLIDTINGQTIDSSSQDKLSILHSLINEPLHSGVVMSKSAKQIYQHVDRLMKKSV